MTVHLKTIQAASIKSLFEVLHSVLNDVNILFDKDGMRILTMDISKTSLVNVLLEASMFEEYECVRPLIAGVNMTNMFKLLKSISNNDILTIDINSTEKMELMIENVAKKSKTRFDLKLLDLDDDILEVPNMNMSIITTLPSVDFQRICRDMSHLSTKITMGRKDNVFTISCNGDFADQLTNIECGDDTGNGKHVNDTYSLQYILLFTKATSMCSSVQIFQEETSQPIVFKYNVANLGFIEFYLAPIVSD